MKIMLSLHTYFSSIQTLYLSNFLPHFPTFSDTITSLPFPNHSFLISIFLYLFDYIYISLSLSLSFCLLVCLSVCLSLSLSLSISLHLSISLVFMSSNSYECARILNLKKNNYPCHKCWLGQL